MCVCGFFSSCYHEFRSHLYPLTCRPNEVVTSKMHLPVPMDFGSFSLSCLTLQRKHKPNKTKPKPNKTKKHTFHGCFCFLLGNSQLFTYKKEGKQKSSTKRQDTTWPKTLEDLTEMFWVAVKDPIELASLLKWGRKSTKYFETTT